MRSRSRSLAIIDRVTGPKRERSLYEIASSFFAVVVIVFAGAGMLVTGLGDEGVRSGAFAICMVFLLLGLGRLYLGLSRRNEGAEDGTLPAAEAPPKVRRQGPAGPSSRRPPRPRRPD